MGASGVGEKRVWGEVVGGGTRKRSQQETYHLLVFRIHLTSKCAGVKGIRVSSKSEANVSLAFLIAREWRYDTVFPLRHV